MGNYNVDILRAIYGEYGLETFVKRLKKIYNIDIAIKDGLCISFLNNQILVNYFPEGDYSSIITFEEEQYKHVKIFKGYYVTTHYDTNHIQFKKTISFYTSDNKILAIDEIDASNIISRRFIKSTESDKDLTQGEFEREQLYYPKSAAVENYSFKNNSGNVNIKKTLGMSNCLYYYSYQSQNIIPTTAPICTILEVGSSTNRPTFNRCGRIRNNTELLIDSIKKGIPNIIIRGAIIGAQTSKVCYKISILKSNEAITVHYLSSDISANDPKTKVIVVPTERQGEITLGEIDNIIIAIRNNLTQELYDDFNSSVSIESIISELISLKNEMQINKKQKLRNADALDFKLNQYSSIERLGLDVYENLKLYEEYINSQLGIKPQNPDETLKKN